MNELPLNFYLLDPNTGSMHRVDIATAHVKTEQQIIDQLSARKVTEIRNVFKVSGANASIKRLSLIHI